MFFETIRLQIGERTGSWQSLSREERRAKKLALQDSEIRLLRQYGFEGIKSKTLISRHLCRGLNHWDVLTMSSADALMDAEERLKQVVEQHRPDYFTRQEVEHMLGKYSLQALMPFIHPNNFVFDTQKSQQ